MTQNKFNFQEKLNLIHQTIIYDDNKGEVAQYIPELAKVNPNHFGAYLLTEDGEGFGVGDWNMKFSIQSIVKVLSLSLVYKILDGKIWKRVGVEPSGNPYNSLVQLETDNGIPRNPFINAGAIVVCDVLIDELENPSLDFLAFVRNISNNQNISYNESIVQSEKSVGYRNIAWRYGARD